MENNLPKCLMLVKGKPILQWICESAFEVTGELPLVIINPNMVKYFKKNGKN